MKFYKDDKNQVHAFDDKQVLNGLADGLTPITEYEKKQLLAPTAEQMKAEQAATIKARLSEIDSESLRPLRAIQQGNATQSDNDKLTALDTEAVQLRSQLAGL